MSKIYTFEFKKKLKDRIEKITDKKTLEKIRDIIFKYNPKVSVCLTDMAGKTKYEAENDGKFIATSPESVEWLIEELEKDYKQVSSDVEPAFLKPKIDKGLKRISKPFREGSDKKNA